MQDAFVNFLNKVAEEFNKTANGWDTYAAYVKTPQTKGITLDDWNTLIGLLGHTDAYVRALRPVLTEFGPAMVNALIESSKGNFIDHIKNSETDEGNIVIVMKDGSEFSVASYRGPQGASITDVAYDSECRPTYTLSDGSTIFVNKSLRGPQGIQGIEGPQGKQGIVGPQGSPFRYEDFTPQQLEALRGPQGLVGPEGPAGRPFQAARVYSSVVEMQNGFDTDGVAVGEYVIISTPDVNDPDNSKVYVKTETKYNFLTDMSGKEGIQGPEGKQGVPGPAPVRGIDYWTSDDIATIREYVNLSILEGRW